MNIQFSHYSNKDGLTLEDIVKSTALYSMREGMELIEDAQHALRFIGEDGIATRCEIASTLLYNATDEDSNHHFGESKKIVKAVENISEED